MEIDELMDGFSHMCVWEGWVRVMLRLKEWGCGDSKKLILCCFIYLFMDESVERLSVQDSQL